MLNVEVIPGRIAHLDVSENGSHLSAKMGEPAIMANAAGGTGLKRLIGDLDGPLAWISVLEVPPGARSRGIGSRLLRTALDEMGKMGIRYVLLHADPEKDELGPALRRFYGRFGFGEIREYKGWIFEFPLMMARIAG